MSNTTQDHSGGLAKGSITPLEVGMQSVANVAPSAVIAFTPAAMAAYAGNGTWFSFLIGLGIVLVIAYSISQIARRRAGAGSLGILARPALGASGSFATGWALFIGVVAITAGSLPGAAYFLSRALDNVHVTGFDGKGGQIILNVLVLVVATYLTITSIRLSARVSSILELTSIAVIVVVLVIVLVKSGNFFDTAQWKLTGSTLNGIVFAIVLAILGFVGFESAAALGEESQNPFRAIPRAIRGSAILAGVLYIFAAYAQVGAFKGGPSALATSASPMDDLAVQYGISWFQLLLNLGITASFFAVVVACINVAGRLLFTWGNEGLMGSWLAQAHPKHRTPSHAIYLVFIPILIPPVWCLLAGLAPLAVVTYIDTVGVFGYMVAYTLICLAAPIFLQKIKAREVARAWVIGLIGAAALIYVFYRNIWPIPPSPVNTLPYYFLVLFILGLLGFFLVKIRRPAVAAQVGTFADDNPSAV